MPVGLSGAWVPCCRAAHAWAGPLRLDAVLFTDCPLEILIASLPAWQEAILRCLRIMAQHGTLLETVRPCLPDLDCALMGT